MSASIEIDGVNLIPIKEATSLVPYSKDYISRLAREGKIVASQVGRQWYIDAKSLQNFYEVATLHEEVRTKSLSADRKIEINAKEKIDALTETIDLHSRSHRVEALTMSVATLCLGLLVGVGFYTSANISVPEASVISDSQAGVFSTLTEKTTLVSEEISPVAEAKETLTFSEITEYPIFTSENETRFLASTSLGVFIFGERGPVGNENLDVEKLFSDQVSVSFTDENNGVINYVSEDGLEKQLPFVRVPSEEGMVDESKPEVISLETVVETP